MLSYVINRIYANKYHLHRKLIVVLLRIQQKNACYMLASCPQNALMHEDIDGAVFVCWKFFVGMAILITPQVYRRVLDNALKQERNGLSAFCTHNS